MGAAIFGNQSIGQLRLPPIPELLEKSPNDFFVFRWALRPVRRLSFLHSSQTRRRAFSSMFAMEAEPTRCDRSSFCIFSHFRKDTVRSGRPSALRDEPANLVSPPLRHRHFLLHSPSRRPAAADAR